MADELGEVLANLFLDQEQSLLKEISSLKSMLSLSVKMNILSLSLLMKGELTEENKKEIRETIDYLKSHPDYSKLVLSVSKNKKDYFLPTDYFDEFFEDE